MLGAGTGCGVVGGWLSGGQQRGTAGGSRAAEADFGLKDGQLGVRLVLSSKAHPEVSQMTRRWGMGARDLRLLHRVLGLSQD